ncbi:MAG: 3-oxoacyl-ACP reductase FabG [Ruminococcus sp.]|nr:3-oxoacyl-ACP reductase FabG [Ruminococcus sp.]
MFMKIAFVTGGSGGIGSAVCLKLASDGFAVAVGYNKDAASAEALCKELSAQGHVAMPVHIDLSDPGSVREAYDSVVSGLGYPEVLVNNGGAAHIGLFSDMSFEDITCLLDTDLTGAVLLTRLAVPEMTRRHRGRIVNVSSVWGETGASCETVYSAAKAGLIGFTRALGKELAPSGITVNCVSAGAVDTKMNACLSPDELEELVSQIPAGRLGEPREIAALVSFLCSDDAAYITAQVIRADGGWI